MKILTAGALVLALAVPASALAGAQVGVRHGDLNLTNSADAALMLRRLDNAATEACGASKVSVREYRRAVKLSPCYRETIEQALNDLGAPTVTALYRERAVYAARRLRS